MAGLVEGGYRGRVYPVNARAPEIMGLRAYSGVSEIPEPVDLAIVAVPAPAVLPVIEDCGRKGVPFAIVHTAGFAELGPEGAARQQEMVRRARCRGVRIIGPNCMGIYSPSARINTISALPEPAVPNQTGRVAFVGQSGWVTENVMVMGAERGLHFSKVTSIGNQSDLTHEDLLAYLAADADTAVIGFYAEGVRRGREFLELAAEVSRRKPVIVWETGRTEGGARVTMSHTGSAGDALLSYEELASCGVATAGGLEELVDLLVAFSGPARPRGGRIGLLVEAGGAAAAGADAASRLGLELPALSETAQKELSAILAEEMPPFAAPKNPVDMIWTPAVDPAGLYSRCARVMLRETDCLVAVNYVGFDDTFAGVMAAVRDEAGKPLFFVAGHPTEHRDGLSLLTRHGLPAFTMPERALTALAGVLRCQGHSLRPGG